MKSLKIIKNRSDIGAGTRGSDMGIDAMEIAAIKANNSFFTRFPIQDLETRNEAIYNKTTTPFGKQLAEIVTQCQIVSDAIKNALDEGTFPLIMSGDHSSALGTLSGIKAKHPDKRVAAIWIDAHADLHSPYTSPSGNVHGMPLAAALSEDNLPAQINEIDNNTTTQWNNYKNIGSPGPKVLAEDIIFFGVRDTEKPEDDLMERLGIRNYMVHEVRHRGIDACLKEAIQQLDNCDLIYISFDVDSMDCDLISRGTGTPVSKGFEPQEVVEIITHLFSTDKVACLEITEVNPTLDNKGNLMAETAFEVLTKVLPVMV